MDIRLLAMAMLFACWAVTAVAQSSSAASAPPTAAEKSAMERAQREADGPRRRILEAAKVKGTVKTPEPAVVAPAPAPAVPQAVVTPKVAPRDEAPAPAPAPVERVLLTQPTAVAPVALPASDVGRVPSMAKVEVAPAAAALATLPQSPRPELLEPPRLVNKVDPDLPSRLLRRLGNRRMEVIVDLTVQTDGSVGSVTVRSTADDDLVEVVRNALQQWRYEPQPELRLHTVRLVFAQPN